VVEKKRRMDRDMFTGVPEAGIEDIPEVLGLCDRGYVGKKESRIGQGI